MRLRSSTDFALRLLMRLGADAEHHQSTEVLAREIGVPRNHLHKIVQDLTEAGLVRTLRGARGGVMLARPTSGITIGEVVRHLERGQALVECFLPEGGACCFLPGCLLRRSLQRAREAFLAELDRTSLEECVVPGGLGAASSEVV
ncbi:transcriptional regulator, BadM/Rrf2 family [Roseomonas rosea]|uniref:Transcriptional regulator, BadM/Rrf2 family n=1 Tax=Muricoccus roseus TaxID=198092 RepID=A0A1M6N433_9PROT|nr:Rrf2 family transcriptional regulator [Roseomonas rosea]SHJ90373.1 transcriptional regulator, BadM/Rrf2 family [Roseomonas rosea]